MDRYKIQASIKDVISILDSSPIQPDLIAETNIVKLTNRVPVAHLAIERGLKALLTEAGSSAERTHGLHKLYRVLGGCNQKAADYLATAFEDAVSFFGYNVNTKGFKQFGSLDDYLTKVGTDKAFEALRYWAIGESSQGATPISYISLPIHRELLCALWCLFFPTRRETVSTRVEREIAGAMFDRRDTNDSPDGESMKQSVTWYWNWLFKEHATRRSASKRLWIGNSSSKTTTNSSGKLCMTPTPTFNSRKTPRSGTTSARSPTYPRDLSNESLTLFLKSSGSTT